MGMLKEFKEFAMRGNVVDLAVGVVIGGAFGKIVSSLVGDIVMPLVGMLTGGVDFKDKKIALGASENGATLNYGVFVNTVIDFLIVAFAIFLVVKAMNAAKKRFEGEAQAAPAAPPEDIVLLRQIRDSLAKR